MPKKLTELAWRALPRICSCGRMPHDGTFDWWPRCQMHGMDSPWYMDNHTHLKKAVDALRQNQNESMGRK